MMRSIKQTRSFSPVLTRAYPERSLSRWAPIKILNIESGEFQGERKQKKGAPPPCALPFQTVGAPDDARRLIHSF
jgi:hypothetical protein